MAFLRQLTNFEVTSSHSFAISENSLVGLGLHRGLALGRPTALCLPCQVTQGFDPWKVGHAFMGVADGLFSNIPEKFSSVLEFADSVSILQQSPGRSLKLWERRSSHKSHLQACLWDIFWSWLRGLPLNTRDLVAVSP